MGTPTKKLQIIAKFAFVTLVVLLRTLFVDYSARFTRDESSDLTRMHEYFENKKITLVGPISSDNIKVFSSLTYYMLMPFAVIGNFDPISPVYGTAFWGIITAILLWLLVKKINPKLIWTAATLILFWYPLLESSRWAWNPHLVPFWIALGILLSLYESNWLLFFSGASFGLAVHNHYIAFIPGIIYLVIKSITLLKNRDWRRFFAISAGFGLMLMPFVLFDLRHPPGLFIASYLGTRTPHVQAVTSLVDLFHKFGRDCYIAAFTMARQKWAAIMLLTLSLSLITTDVIKRNFRGLLWLLPPVGLIMAGVVLDGFETRYFLSAFIFYFVWLILPRKNWSAKLQTAVLGLLILSSLMALPKMLSEPSLKPNIKTIRAVANKIEYIMESNKDIKNANITADSSEDLDMLSLKYRDLLSIRDISFRAASEYDVSEHLFVVSQGTEADLRQSPSYPLLVFGKQKLRGTYLLNDSNWKVFWFSY